MSKSVMLAQPGMDVFGCDAEHVGQVKEVRADGLLVGGTRHTDVFVPRGSIADVIDAEHRVDLTVRADEVAGMDQGTA